MPLPNTSTYKSSALTFPEYRGRKRFREREREFPLKNKREEMAEDFQAGICGGNSWNFLRSVLAGGSSPCLSGYNDIGSYGWSATELNSVSDSFLNFPGLQKAAGGSLLMDSDGLMMGFDLSSSLTSDWNQTVLSRGNGRTDSNLNSLFQEHTAPDGNRRHEEPIGFDDHRSSSIRNDGSPNNFSTITDEDNSIDHNLKPVDRDFYPDQGRLNSDICSGNSRMFSAAFPVGSTSYGYPSPLLLQTLSNSRNQQSSSLTSNVNRSINSSTSANYGLNCEDLSLSRPKLPSTSSHTKPSIQQQQNGGFHFSNNTPYWNSSSSPSSQPQLIASFFAEKPKCHNLTTKKLQLYTGEDVQEWGSVTKRSNGGLTDSVIKRPRIETPSPLPTFKVRKEKLGDRITALQQLVSPFGKTDTASVLHEAIDYIKFLHDQVSVLSTPYMKSGVSIHHQEISEKYPESKESKQELRSRGLCLVPISSTFAAANETTPEFWTPTFGGTFK